MNHVCDILMFRLGGKTLFGMAVAGAGSSDDHVVDGVVVLLLDVDRAAAKVLVTESVQLGEGDAEVGHLEKVLHLLAVRVEPGGVGVDGAGKNSIDYLSLGGGCESGVPL